MSKFGDAFRRITGAPTPPPVQEPAGSLARLSPDGLPVVDLPSSYTSLLRLYGAAGSYAQIYASQYNVRTAVDTIAREAATLHMDVYEKNPRGPKLPDSNILLEDHKLHALLEEPKPGMSVFRWWYQLFADMAIYDIAFWIKVRQRGKTKALVRVPPQYMIVIRDPLTYQIQGYKTPDGKVYSLDDLVVFWGYDPQANEGAISPMESMRRLIAEEVAAGLDREGRWRNAARKEGVITRDVNAPKMDDVAKEGFLLDMEDALAGDKGSGRMLVLQPGMDIKDYQWSPREMEYMEARRFSRLEVCSFFHMPPAMMAASHIGQDPSSETLDYFYTSTLPPWLYRVEREIEAQLVPEFERTPERRRAVFVRFNLDEKLRGSFEKRIGILATAAGGPIITVNEARAREGLPPIPGGDLIFVPLNSIRAGGPQASPQNPVATPAGEGREPAGTTPGGGTQPQASLEDVNAGRAVVLGKEQAERLMSSDLWENVTSADQLIEAVDAKYEARKANEEHKLFLSEQMGRYQALARQTFLNTFERQKSVIQRDAPLKHDRWNRELADDLYAFVMPAITTIGEDAAKRRGTTFDWTRSSEFVQAYVADVAKTVNAQTDDEKDLSEARAENLGASLTRWLLEWSVQEAARQSGP